MTASMPGPGTDCKFSCAVCSRRLQVLQTFGRIRVTGISSSYSSYDNLNTRLRASEVLPAGLGSVDRNRCPSLLTAALDPIKSPGQLEGLPGGFNGLENFIWILDSVDRFSCFGIYSGYPWYILVLRDKPGYPWYILYTLHLEPWYTRIHI